MAFIEVANLKDDYEDVTVPEGEYDLLIHNVKEGKSKKGNADQIVAMIKIQDEDYPSAALIFHYLTFPTAEDEADTRRMKMRQITRFLNFFNVPFEKDGLNSEDMMGCTARGTLIQEEYEGDINNKIRLPKAA